MDKVNSCRIKFFRGKLLLQKYPREKIIHEDSMEQKSRFCPFQQGGFML